MKNAPLNIHIEVSFIHETIWKTLFDPPEGIEAWLAKMTELVLEALDCIPSSSAVEVSFLFADDAKVQELNQTFRRQDKPTNVLSFPSFERDDYGGGRLPYVPVLLLGDIVFARETIQREALSSGKSFEAHLTHLLVHGLLHLRGLDHETEAEANEMESLEVAVLSRLGISNPYEFSGLL